MKTETNGNKFTIASIADVYALPTLKHQEQCLCIIRSCMKTARTFEEITRGVILKNTGTLPERTVFWPGSFTFVYVESEEGMDAMHEHIKPGGIIKEMQDRTEGAIPEAYREEIIGIMKAQALQGFRDKMKAKIMEKLGCPEEVADGMVKVIMDKAGEIAGDFDPESIQVQTVDLSGMHEKEPPPFGRRSRYDGTDGLPPWMN